MPNATWKQAEREVANRLGCERVGPSGESTADVVNDWLAVECKHRKRLPQWLKAALEQAEGAAEDGQLPVAVLHEKHSEYDQALVVLRLEEFRDWFCG